MKGLHTARAVLIDDDAEDSQRLLAMLGQHGVGAVYVDPVHPPAVKLAGIRLAALDIVLFPGVEGDPVPSAANIVEAVIDPKNGPYLAVIWTSKDSDEATRFCTRLNQGPVPPLACVFVEKTPYTNGDKGAAELLGAIDEKLRTLDPLALLTYWEQIIHDAATATVWDISPIATTWQDDASKVLAVLLRAAAPSERVSDASSMRSLFGALNALHFDNVDSSTSRIATVDADALIAETIKLVDKAGKKPIDGVELAVLNRRLNVDSSPTAYAPGSMFILPDDITKALSIESLAEFIGSDMLNANFKEQGIAGAGARAIGVEVTPVCDYQQGRPGPHRLLVGVAVPAAELKRIKNEGGAAFMYSHGPIRLDGALGGERFLCFTSHLTFALAREQIEKLEAFGRLRESAFTALMTWLGAQTTRSGYLQLR